MRCNDFRTGVEEHGQFKGRRYVEILPNSKNTKVNKLNLLNDTFDCDPEKHRIHEDPDDPLCYVKLWHHYNEKCLPPPESGVDIGQNNRFFCHEAPDKELKARRRKGIMYTAGLKPQQLVGKNAIPAIINEIACECDFIHPERQTAASLRSEHICTLVNAKEAIDPKTVMDSSRHKTILAHNVYKRKIKDQLDLKTKAFHEEKHKKLVVRFLSYFITSLLLLFTIILSIHTGV